MQFMLDIRISSPEPLIAYTDTILVVGSCFTEHIGGRLARLKFSVLQNPHGILFDPLSVAKSLESYIENKQYNADDLIMLNEVWQSWQHHSAFSGVDQEKVIQKMNASQQAAHQFLKQADWMIITLGSSFFYQLLDQAMPVANCHRAPASWFQKRMLDIDETVIALDRCIERLFQFNPRLKVIFTVSPVRHIRDGVIENNRSKARLIESVHQLADKHKQVYYFPAYELVIDVLRDYRFYDIDLVHPNYAATEYVFSKFSDSYIEPESRKLMDDLKEIITAFNHKPFQPSTQAHRQFLTNYLKKFNSLSKKILTWT